MGKRPTSPQIMDSNSYIENVNCKFISKYLLTYHICNILNTPILCINETESDEGVQRSFQLLVLVFVIT